ncbi:MAG: DUF4124 domain-containing protein [Steroidobacteraceae bacterium]|nr:DUF4124 domain-containing protein [Steroidobacteraceae bacterium]MDW8259003.1 DUF4124 domain-containing protein [Gammaproteobacteria bacterium]
MTRAVFTLFRCALPLAAAAAFASETARGPIYKWVDKDGITHYSDKPQPGAEEIALPQPQTYQAPQGTAAPSAGRRAAAPTAVAAAEKLSCALREPTNDQVYLNVPSLQVRFAGPLGSTAVVSLNGKRYTASAEAGSVTIEPIFRGTYQTSVSFQNASGTTLCQTPTVTFHVRQPTVFGNPSRPRPTNPR